MKTKICAVYKDGILIPETDLNLENNSKVEIILEDDVFSAFSLAGKEENIEDYFFAQREILENGSSA